MVGVDIQFGAELVDELTQLARFQVYLLHHKILELVQIFVSILVNFNELNDGRFLWSKGVKGTRHEVGIVLHEGLFDGLFFGEIYVFIFVSCLSTWLIVSLL